MTEGGRYATTDESRKIQTLCIGTVVMQHVCHLYKVTVWICLLTL